MTLKPRFPIFEISILLILLFSGIRFLFAGISKHALASIMLGMLLFICFIVLTYLVNKNFLRVRLEDTLVVRGFFGGEKKIILNDIGGFKLRKIKIPKRFGHDFSLTVVGNGHEIKFEVLRGDYNATSFDAFVNTLHDKEIPRLE